MQTRSNPPLTLGAWFRHDEIARVVNAQEPSSVLEFGVGQGAMGARLATGRNYVGIEPDDDSRAIARNNLPSTARLLATVDEVGDEQFDLICAFEVLEHIEDDRTALEEWLTRLAPGGSVVVSVPGFAERFGPWDRHVGHFRRYDPDQIEALLRSVGLEDTRVVATGYPLGFALEAARNKVAVRRMGSLGTGAGDENADLEPLPAADAAQRTAASGRLFQPSALIGPIYRYVSAPFRTLQQRRPDRGVGIVASGVKGPTAASR